MPEFVWDLICAGLCGHTAARHVETSLKIQGGSVLSRRPSKT